MENDTQQVQPAPISTEQWIHNQIMADILFMHSDIKLDDKLNEEQWKNGYNKDNVYIKFKDRIATNFNIRVNPKEDRYEVAFTFPSNYANFGTGRKYRVKLARINYLIGKNLKLDALMKRIYPVLKEMVDAMNKELSNIDSNVSGIQGLQGLLDIKNPITFRYGELKDGRPFHKNEFDVKDVGFTFEIDEKASEFKVTRIHTGDLKFDKESFKTFIKFFYDIKHSTNAMDKLDIL